MIEGIVEHLVRTGLATRASVDAALAASRRNRGSLVLNLVVVGGVDGEALANLISQRFILPRVKDSELGALTPATFRLLPVEIVYDTGILPLGMADEDRLLVGVLDPTEEDSIEEAAFFSGFDLERRILSVPQLSAAFARLTGRPWKAEVKARGGVVSTAGLSPTSSLDERLEAMEALLDKRFEISSSASTSPTSSPKPRSGAPVIQLTRDQIRTSDVPAAAAGGSPSPSPSGASAASSAPQPGPPAIPVRGAPSGVPHPAGPVSGASTGAPPPSIPATASERSMAQPGPPAPPASRGRTRPVVTGEAAIAGEAVVSGRAQRREEPPAPKVIVSDSLEGIPAPVVVPPSLPDTPVATAGGGRSRKSATNPGTSKAPRVPPIPTSSRSSGASGAHVETPPPVRPVVAEAVDAPVSDRDDSSADAPVSTPVRVPPPPMVGSDAVPVEAPDASAPPLAAPQTLPSSEVPKAEHVSEDALPEVEVEANATGEDVEPALDLPIELMPAEEAGDPDVVDAGGPSSPSDTPVPGAVSAGAGPQPSAPWEVAGVGREASRLTGDDNLGVVRQYDALDAWIEERQGRPDSDGWVAARPAVATPQSARQASEGVETAAGGMVGGLGAIASALEPAHPVVEPLVGLLEASLRTVDGRDAIAQTFVETASIAWPVAIALSLRFPRALVWGARGRSCDLRTLVGERFELESGSIWHRVATEGVAWCGQLPEGDPLRRLIPGGETGETLVVPVVLNRKTVAILVMDSGPWAGLLAPGSTLVRLQRAVADALLREIVQRKRAVRSAAT